MKRDKKTSEDFLPIIVLLGMVILLSFAIGYVCGWYGYLYTL